MADYYVCNMSKLYMGVTFLEDPQHASKNETQKQKKWDAQKKIQNQIYPAFLAKLS